MTSHLNAALMPPGRRAMMGSRGGCSTAVKFSARGVAIGSCQAGNVDVPPPSAYVLERPPVFASSHLIPVDPGLCHQILPVTPDDALPRDKEGVEIRDLAKAKAEAIVFVGESLKDKPQDLCRNASFQVDVTDDKGLILFSVVAITVDAPVIEIEHLASEAPLQRAFN